MLEYIKRIPVLNARIEKEDLQSAVFPAQIEEVFNIRLINELKGINITYRDNVFADSQQRSEDGDIIFITFSIRGLSNIEITLKISEIFFYGCNIATLMEKRATVGRYDYSLSGFRLDIMDRNDYINNNNPSKYMILISDDIMQIDAGNVVISDIKYIKSKIDYSENFIEVKPTVQSNVDRQDKVFREYVSKYFDFILKDYGYKIQIYSDYQINFIKDNVLLIINSLCAITFYIEKLNIYDSLKISLNDILIYKNVKPLGFNWFTNSKESLNEGLKIMSEFTKKYAHEFLIGNEVTYLELISQKNEKKEELRKLCSLKNKGLMNKEAEKKGYSISRDFALENYGKSNIERNKEGLPPQRYNPIEGKWEDMVLRREPVQDSAEENLTVPRWITPYRVDLWRIWTEKGRKIWTEN